MPRIIILGGGPAGYEAALVAAGLGAKVTIVTEEGLGGNSVLWDCVPSKALIVAAEAMGWVGAAHRMGVHTRGVQPGDDPAIGSDIEVADALATHPFGVADGTLDDGSVPGEATAVDLPYLGRHVLALGASQSRDIEATIAAAGVTVVRGWGRISGDRQITATLEGGDERVLHADHVLLATGSRARVLPFFVPDGQRVLVGQQVYALPAVPEHLIVVGSGATGAEFAHAFRRFGAQVTLVSSRDLILPTEDPDAAQVIEEVFERRGMRIVRHARAERCETDGTQVTVGLEDGREVVGSHVLFTVGQVPNTTDVGLEVCGVTPGPHGGVEVDAVGRTSCGWLYAAGDVVGTTMLASVAAMQGRTAMWHALGAAVQPIRWDAIAATIFTDPEVATVGWSAVDANQAGFQTVTARLDLRGNPRAKMGGATDGFVKLHAMVGSGTVVGGVVVARRASELIQPIALAVQQRLSVAQLAQTVTVYPSMSGSVAECARLLMDRLEHP